MRAINNHQNIADNKYLTPNRSKTKIVSHIKKPGRNSISNSALNSGKNAVLMYQYYAFEYEFQDDLPDTNTIFWDSNLRKFRTRSCAKSQNESSLSKSIDILSKNSYNNYNRNSYASNRNKGVIPKKFAENKVGRSKNNYHNNNYNNNLNGSYNSTATYPQNRKADNYNQPLYNKNRQISLSQNQTLKSQNLQGSQINAQDNNQENNENNVSVVKKFKEKTIALLPGQTIEPQTKNETFENPVEIIIENPDGTKTSLIKQTKITTITENIPIEENKVQSLEGAPNLPLIRQLINYEYKTVTKLKEQIYDNNENNNRGQDNNAVPSENQNDINNNFRDECCTCEEQGNYSSNNYVQKYGNNATGDRKGNEKSWNNQENMDGDINQNYDINLNNNRLDNEYDNNEMNINNKNINNKDIGYQKDRQHSNNNKYVDSQEGRNLVSGEIDERNEVQLNDSQNCDKQNLAKDGNKSSFGRPINPNDKAKSPKKGINSNMDNKKNANDKSNLNQRIKGQEDGGEVTNEKDKLIGNENEGENNNSNIGNIKNSEENEDLVPKNNENGKEIKNLRNKKNIGKFKDEKNLEINEKNNYGNIQNNNIRKSGKNNNDKISPNTKDKGLQDSENLESKINVNSRDGNQKDENENEKANKKELTSKNKNLNKNKKYDKNEKNKALGESEKKNKKGGKSPSKDIKNENERIIEEINNKGENATPEEKEKRLQYLEDLYNNISKEGNDSEENLDKLSKILNNINENDKKEILNKLSKKYPDKDILYKDLKKLVEDKGNKKQNKEEEKQCGKSINNEKNKLLKGGKKSSSKKGKNKDTTKSEKKGEKEDEQNSSLKTDKIGKKEGKKDELKKGKKKLEKDKKNDLLNSREKISEKSNEKRLETKEKDKDDLLKSGKKESEEKNDNNTFKPIKKKSGRNAKKSLQKSGKKESEDYLKDSFAKKLKREEDLEVNNELSKSIKLENRGSKYRLSKRHSANKERLSSHQKNQTIDLFETKNINPIKFEELFLDITKYARERKEKNPFEGPSPYTEFYKERRIKIKEKIIQMASGEIGDNIEIKLEENEKGENEIKEEDNNNE